MKDRLINEILKYTKSRQSINFYIKAIDILGEDRVSGELGELKYQIRTGAVKDPAKYFTTLLNNQIKNYENTQGKEYSSKEAKHFEHTQQELFRHLMPRDEDKGEDGAWIESKELPLPYSGKNIPHPTFIGPEFFTLSTNKKNSDMVKAKFRALNGAVRDIDLIRGKYSKYSNKEFGILTVQHKKVFDALKISWARKGCPCLMHKDGTEICFVLVSAREIADLLGWQSFGGRELIRLKDYVGGLNSSPYTFDLTEFEYDKIKNFNMTLIGNVTTITLTEQGGEKTYFKVFFSSAVSYQLIKKHAVMRSIGMLTVRSELASLVWSYLEPNLIAHGNSCIDLKNLIDVLQLPKANWHKKGWRRKQVFEKAIKELDNRQIIDSGIMKVSIEKGLNDWQLIASLNTEKLKEKVLNK